jgi:hypothetical protein
LQHGDAFKVSLQYRIAKRERLDDPAVLVVEFIDDRSFIGYREQPLIGR